jgi:hypothetical protein
MSDLTAFEGRLLRFDSMMNICFLLKKYRKSKVGKTYRGFLFEIAGM